MKTTTIRAALLLSTMTAAALVSPAMAQRGDGNRAENRQGRILAGRIVKATLTAVNFSPAKVTLKATDDGEIIDATCGASAIFHDSRTGVQLMDFYRNSLNKTVYAEVVKSQGAWTLRELWDEGNWDLYKAKHDGIKTGGISSRTNRVLQLSGDLRYTLSKDTKWRKGGNFVEPDAYSVRDTVYVKADISGDAPLALVVADSANDPTLVGVNTDDRVAAPGGVRGIGGRTGGKKPSDAQPPAGNTRPPSTGAPAAANYRIHVYAKITNSSDPVVRGPGDALLDILDNKVECFGELRVNGAVVWSIPNTSAKNNKRAKSETLQILTGDGHTLNASTLTLKGFVRDDDVLGYETLCAVDTQLNLAEWAGRGYQRVATTGAAADLYVRVERL